MPDTKPTACQAPDPHGTRHLQPAPTAVVIDHPSRSNPAARSRPAHQADTGESRPISDVEATADYIAQLSSELARLADSQRLTVLSYFLDMAAVEARALVSAAARR